MIKSMTGFGRNSLEKEGRTYSVEIKSVNHKYNDISVKIPKSISYLEEKVKKEITANISRGKIDVLITFDNNSTKGKNIKINKDLANMYIQELKKLAQQNNINSSIEVTEISKFPDVLVLENIDDEETVWKELSECLNYAINNFIEMRKVEGQKISEDLDKKINEVSLKVQEISKFSTRLVDDYIVKLETRIKEILKTDIIDKDRLAQEIVIYADKCSVEEEIIRLNSHICQFNDLIKEDIPVGKKLDFLMQEMNREINTIGSKTNSLEITNLVIDIKTKLEDIREQVQNLE